MPTYRRGDYWTEYNNSDLFLFTSCGVVTQSRLVMGAGTARQVRDRFVGIDKAIASSIIKHGYPCIDGIYVYRLLVSDRWPVGKVGAFQTKEHWRDPSPIDLIRESIRMLQAWCSDRPNARVDLPFPGIGCGNLERWQVIEYLDVLPDQVNVWEL